ncbi:MAG TPA: lysylphosphatidylglycerol synthase transmembrane domain-containing protein, partial [Cyclobacteriaceae bacterium]|nr:lysylphosphatidylglycerol synthase transmembrane domain-containing protein [Cyclobacteriaceae bacterium]
MPKTIKSILQYAVMLLLTAALVWFSLSGLKGENKTEFIWDAWKKADKWWLVLMAVIAFISHYVRAVRWKMLLIPSGNHIGSASSFLSLMIGYLVNLAVPRGGEVSRCYNLYKLEGTPVEISFGTVVIERIADVLCLVVVIIIAFVVEWHKLLTFVSSLGIGTGGEGFRVPVWAILAAVLMVIAALIAWQFRKNEKLLRIITGFKEGLLSVFRLKNKWLFIFYSVLIWFLYFLMSYCVIQAFETTSFLGFSVVLAVFALGAIAMAAPLPGGAGSYHVIVPRGMVALFGLPQTDAVAFVFIFHAWQTLTMIAGGM